MRQRLQLRLRIVRPHRSTALQTDTLAKFELHAQMQTFQPAQPMDSLLADRPALAFEHDQDAQIPESRSVHSDVPNVLTQLMSTCC